MPVCDECITAMGDEGAPEGTERYMAILMGAEVADHICERTEDKTIRCDCSCQ